MEILDWKKGEGMLLWQQEASSANTMERSVGGCPSSYLSLCLFHILYTLHLDFANSLFMQHRKA